MKIAALIPTRDRINNIVTLIASMIVTADNIENIVLYLGVDDDDPSREKLMKLSKAIPFVKFIPIHNNGCYIGINKIWNILARESSEDILGYLGDDMVFRTTGWDTEIIKEFTGKNLPDDKIKVVQCHNGWHNENPGCCINGFMHRKYMDVLGYFVREEFPIEMSDVWMYQTFAAFDRVKFRFDILIEHMHWAHGKMKKDSTADRMRSDENLEKSYMLWDELLPEKEKDIKILGKYLNLEPLHL
jgi:hypothetical protein